MLATDYDKTKLKHLPEIIIRTIHHDDQRYETCGDWFYDNTGAMVICISETSTKYEFLVAVHELVEAFLCDFKGIKEKDVTEFDHEFEEMRGNYPHLVGDDEPGDNEKAPYYHEHKMASRVEHWLADSCGVDWSDYEKTINALEQF